MSTKKTKKTSESQQKRSMPYKLSDCPFLNSPYGMHPDDGAGTVKYEPSPKELNDRAKMEGSIAEEVSDMAFIRRLEDGRVIKLEDAKFSEFVNGDWSEPSADIYLDEYWNAESVAESDLAAASKSEKSN